MLSRLSVSLGIGDCFRLRYSSRYLRISPLHREFYRPPPDSSYTVSNAFLQLSRSLLHSTYITTYTPFTPSNSEQRSPLTYYRRCWHVISRGLFIRYRHRRRISSLLILPLQKRFTIRRPSSLTRRRSVRVSPIAEDSWLLPPVGVGTVSQFPCG